MVATIGFFDGVHCGHKFLISQVADEAKKRGLKSLVITFPKHPLEVLRPEFRPELLSDYKEKADLLFQAGADNVALMGFSSEMAAMTAKEFMEWTLRDQLHVTVLVIGYDHKFGRGASDTFEDYVRYGKELGIEVLLAKELESAERRYSSSTVRKALKDGDIDTATAVLGRRYTIEGLVVSGFGNGRKLGFPTANIEVLGENKLIPRNGVYAVNVRFMDGSREGEFGGMMNIGCRPTLDNGEQRTIEIHLFDFDADIYSSLISVELIARIRDERRFDTIEELQSQLAEDRNDALRILRIDIPS